MGIGVLGPVSVDEVDGLGLRDRIVLEVLVVRAGEAVDKHVLADALWGETPPATWPKVVQGCIARLRKLLPADAITTTPYGYRLLVHEDQLDARRFERMLARAREHMADHDPDRASYVVAEALSLWRGRALPDLDEWEPGRAEAERLDGLCMDTQELRVEAEIAAGRHRTVLEGARRLVKEGPFRERRWALLAQALYKSGRQTEALEVLNRARRMLRDELGLDPGQELLALAEAILRQDPALDASEAVQTRLECPYRGLLPYEAGDAEAFFGRDADVAACLDRLRTYGVLAVVGPSGTGKSSLVRAGVVASLERDGSKVVVTTPGTRPLDSLAGLPARPPHPVLVVDQAEEAVTLCTDLTERAAYFERLDAYGGPLVIALRADRLGDLSTYPQFARLVERGLYLLAGMSEDNLRAAIEGPARHAGLRLEAGLVDVLVREVEGEPGALPLLSHVLRQTWEMREGPTLTVAGYRATGGIRNAIALSAERLYEQLDDQHRSQVRALFLRLVTPSEDGQPVRARVPRKKVATDSSHAQLVDALVDARLVSSYAGDVQIAHEALAREWPRLRGWLEEDKEGQRIFRHLTAAADAWDTMGRPDSEMYRGIRLADAADWVDHAQVELTDTERAFLDESRAHAQREHAAAQQQLDNQRRSNRRLRLSLLSTAALLVVALVAGVLAVVAANRSDEQARRAAALAQVADSRRLAAQALLEPEPDLALLLAAESMRLDDSVATRSALYSLFGKTSQLIGVARGGADGFTDVEADARGTVTTSGPRSGITTWDSATLEKIAAHEAAPVAGVVASADGRRLAYAMGTLEVGDQRPVRVLDATTLEPAVQLGGLPDRTIVPGEFGFSGDGRRLAAAFMSFDEGGNGVAAQVWDMGRPARPVRTIPFEGVRASVALDPRGDVLYLATRGPSLLRSYDVNTGQRVASRPVKYLSERQPPIVVSPDGAIVATSHRDGIVVFGGDGLEQRFVLPGLADGVTALEFSDDGTRLASGFTSGTTIVWDLATRRPVRTLRGHSQPVEGLAFAPSGGTLYTASNDGQLLAWDLTGSHTFPPATKYPDNPRRDTFVAVPSPDAQTVAYFTYGAQLQFRDVASGRLTRAHDVAFRFPSYFEYAWSPDSDVFVLTGGAIGAPGGTDRHALQVWDPTTGNPTYTEPDTRIDALWFTSDGTQMVTLDEQGTVTVLDADTRQPAGDPIDFGAPWSHERPALSPDESTLFVPVMQDDVEYMQVVNLPTRTASRTSLDTIPPGATFSPDGGLVAIIYRDGNWGVMEADSLGAEDPRWVVSPRRFTGPNEFAGMVWSADGSHLLTLGPGTVDVWDSRSLTHLGTLNAGPADQVPDVRPLPDGHAIMVAHPAGDIITWDLRPQHLLEVACDRAGRNLTKEEWATNIGTRPYRATCPNA